jgi:hypothetical protein
VLSVYLFVVSVVLSHSILLVGRVLEERNSGHKQQDCEVKDEKGFGGRRARIRVMRSSNLIQSARIRVMRSIV